MFGPVIIGELLSRDIPVVGVVVGCDESTKACENTLKSLKTLEGVATARGKPVVIYYDHNKRGTPQSEIDASLESAIAALAILASRQNRELDSADIANFLQFHKVSSVRPQVALLQIYESVEKVNKIKNPIAIASLYADRDQQTVEVIPDYSCVGYCDQLTGDIRNLHFIITVDEVQEIGQAVQRTLDGLNEISKSRAKKASLVNDDDKILDNGLIL